MISGTFAMRNVKERVASYFEPNCMCIQSPPLQFGYDKYDK